MTLALHTAAVNDEPDGGFPRFSYMVQPFGAAWIVRVNGAIIADFPSREDALEGAHAMARDTGRIGYPAQVCIATGADRSGLWLVEPLGQAGPV